MRILRGPLPERGMLQPLDLQGPQTPNRGPEEIRIRGTDRLLLASELHWFRAPRRPRTRYRSWAWRLRGAYKQRRLRPPRSAGEVRPSDCAPTRASNLEGGPHTTCGKQCDRGDERGTGAYTSHERRLGTFCGLRFPPSKRHSNCRAFIMCVFNLQENAGATYCRYLSPERPEEVVRIDADGWGAFTCPEGGLQVWVRAGSQNGFKG